MDLDEARARQKDRTRQGNHSITPSRPGDEHCVRGLPRIEEHPHADACRIRRQHPLRPSPAAASDPPILKTHPPMRHSFNLVLEFDLRYETLTPVVVLVNQDKRTQNAPLRLRPTSAGGSSQDIPEGNADQKRANHGGQNLQ
jgi:hypothetical protein